MKITAITAYRVALPVHEGSYKWSGGNSVDVFDSTVVAVVLLEVGDAFFFKLSALGGHPISKSIFVTKFIYH